MWNFGGNSPSSSLFFSLISSRTGFSDGARRGQVAHAWSLWQGVKKGRTGREKRCGAGWWFEGTENERGRWRDECTGQTLNDFHCFQKLSYQRDSVAPRLLPFARAPLNTVLSRRFPPLESPSTPSTELRCAVYKPCPTRNGTSFELFPSRRAAGVSAAGVPARTTAFASLYEF